MESRNLFAFDVFRARSLIYVLPVAIAVLLVETTKYTGFTAPVPFMSIFVCVVFAGAAGGLWAGTLAAIIASGFVFHSYLIEFGPPTLTGSIGVMSIGICLVMLTGVMLGRLKDQRDCAFEEVRLQRDGLQTSLRSETAEKNKQTARIQTSDLRLQNAVRVARIGYFSFSAETGDCLFCSDQHAAHFGLTPDQFVAMTAGMGPKLQHVHKDDREMVAKVIELVDGGQSHVFEYRAVRPNGEVRYIREMEEPVFNEAGQHVESLGTSLDLTELKEAEIRVRQSQKIEALGKLTGGVAHDFNNLSAIILGNLELVLEQGPTHDWEDLIKEAIRATNRGAALTRSLLSFSRKAHLEPTTLNLNQVVQETTDWARRVVPATIAIKTTPVADLWNVDVDASSLESALVNILLNAREAMPDGGAITIETANIRIDETCVDPHTGSVAPGRYVTLAISDTGTGISEDMLDKVFEPFYTNKPVGKGSGSGLGLSMVQGFMEQSGGAVRVSSEIGVGTTLTLYFKASADVSNDVQPHKVQTNSPLPGETNVLLVEDEPVVKSVLLRILKGAGYRVTTATNGDEALRVFENADHFDVLLTDIVMPGTLQGPALSKAIRQLSPGFPCVFLSGYAEAATVQGNGLLPTDIRLMKPVSRLDLLKALKSALENR